MVNNLLEKKEYTERDVHGVHYYVLKNYDAHWSYQLLRNYISTYGEPKFLQMLNAGELSKEVIDSFKSVHKLLIFWALCITQAQESYCSHFPSEFWHESLNRKEISCILQSRPNRSMRPSRIAQVVGFAAHMKWSIWLMLMASKDSLICSMLVRFLLTWRGFTKAGLTAGLNTLTILPSSC